MTQEKLKRVVTAAAVAGTLVVVCLLAVLLYQVIHIAVLNKRIKNVQKEIDYWTETKRQKTISTIISAIFISTGPRTKKDLFIPEKNRQ